MENIIDASSKYQNSLPISSDAILNLLKTPTPEQTMCP